MLNFAIAMDAARHALRPLFQAYQKNLEDRFEWVAKMHMDPEVAAGLPEVDELIERMGKDNLHVIAGCIIVIGDNLLKTVAHDEFRKLVTDRRMRELKRRFYGHPVRGKAGSVYFGAALYAGANAFRHYEEWAAGASPNAATAEILGAIDVRPDDEASTRILELLTPKGSEWVLTALDLDRFELEIQIAADGMYRDAFAGHVNDG